MNEDLDEINKRMQDILGDLQQWAGKILKTRCRDTIDPMLQSVLKGMGIDFSQLKGMAIGEMALEPYRIMGLNRSASDDEIKKRYKELVHILHPDKSGTLATVHFFQAVTAAYEAIRKERRLQ